LVNNHIGRSEIGIQMLLSPFEKIIDASMVKDSTVSNDDPLQPPLVAAVSFLSCSIEMAPSLPPCHSAFLCFHMGLAIDNAQSSLMTVRIHQHWSSVNDSPDCLILYYVPIGFAMPLRYIVHGRIDPTTQS
jgi:hypothetical protein